MALRIALERQLFLLGEAEDVEVWRKKNEIVELLKQNPKQQIALWVCARGGSIELAIDFYYWVKTERIPLVTIAGAEVSSSTLYIFLAGQRRLAFPVAKFFVHKPGLEKSSAKVSLRPAEQRGLRLFTKDAQDIIYRESKLSRATVEQLFRHERYYQVSEVSQWGVIDKLLSTPPTNKELVETLQQRGKIRIVR